VSEIASKVQLAPIGLVGQFDTDALCFTELTCCPVLWQTDRQTDRQTGWVCDDKLYVGWVSVWADEGDYIINECTEVIGHCLQRTARPAVVWGTGDNHRPGATFSKLPKFSFL